MKKGFTLIELLVVISIIGVLVAVATANLITAQKQARDTRRFSDMQGAQTAFESYYAANQEYPDTDPERSSAFDSGVLPLDPKSVSYSWLSDLDSYCLCATLESKPGNASGSSTDGCTWSDLGPYFCVQNRQ